MLSVTSHRGKASQNHRELSLALHIKKTKDIASVCSDVEKGGPYALAGRNANWCSHCGSCKVRELETARLRKRTRPALYRKRSPLVR